MNMYVYDFSRLPIVAIEVKYSWVACVRKAYSDIADVPLEQVGASISEVPASWVMEGGAILPEPGEEGEEWYKAAAAH